MQDALEVSAVRSLASTLPTNSSPDRQQRPAPLGIRGQHGRRRSADVPGAAADAGARDKTYRVLAKRSVIMNDTRLRGLAVAGSDAAGRNSPDDHAQTAWNLRRFLRKAAAGVRLIQAEGLDIKSADDLAAALAVALEELHRLPRRLDRLIRGDQWTPGRRLSSRSGQWVIKTWAGIVRAGTAL